MQGIFSALKPKLDILTRAIGQANHHALFRQDYPFLYTKHLSMDIQIPEFKLRHRRYVKKTSTEYYRSSKEY